MPVKSTGVFGERLQTVMELIGISRRRLSELSGLTVVCIWLIEKGKTYPTIDTAERLSAALGVDPAWMVGWVDERTWTAPTATSENMFPYGVG